MNERKFSLLLTIILFISCQEKKNNEVQKYNLNVHHEEIYESQRAKKNMMLNGKVKSIKTYKTTTSDIPIAPEADYKIIDKDTLLIDVHIKFLPNGNFLHKVYPFNKKYYYDSNLNIQAIVFDHWGDYEIIDKYYYDKNGFIKENFKYKVKNDSLFFEHLELSEYTIKNDSIGKVNIFIRDIDNNYRECLFLHDNRGNIIQTKCKNQNDSRIITFNAKYDDNNLLSQHSQSKCFDESNCLTRNSEAFKRDKQGRILEKLTYDNFSGYKSESTSYTKSYRFIEYKDPFNALWAGEKLNRDEFDKLSILDKSKYKTERVSLDEKGNPIKIIEDLIFESKKIIHTFDYVYDTYNWISKREFCQEFDYSNQPITEKVLCSYELREIDYYAKNENHQFDKTLLQTLEEKELMKQHKDSLILTKQKITPPKLH